MIAWFPVLALASVTVPHAPTAPARLDTTGPGFRIEERVPVGQFVQFATVSGDTIVVYDGAQIALVDLAHGTESVLTTFSPPVFSSFVVVEPDQLHAIVGESSTHSIFRIALDPAAPAITPIANVPNNFAAVLEGPGHLLVSAVTLQTTADNEILRIELATGLQTLVATSAGPSGPIALAPNGDLYYSPQTYAFPTPPHSRSVIRWTKAQIDSGVLLAESDATILVDRLDGVAALAVDPASGHLLVAESRGAPRISEIDAYVVDATSATHVGTVVASTRWLSNLDFVGEAGSGSFQAFQPHGSALRYSAAQFSPFGTPSMVTTVRTQRPTARTSGPGVGGSGPVLLDIASAHPGALVFVVTAPLSEYVLPESTYPFAGFLLHSGLSPAHFLGAGTWLVTDGFGRASMLLASDGTPTAVQALVADSSGALVGSTTTAFY